MTYVSLYLTTELHWLQSISINNMQKLEIHGVVIGEKVDTLDLQLEEILEDMQNKLQLLPFNSF